MSVHKNTDLSAPVIDSQPLRSGSGRPRTHIIVASDVHGCRHGALRHASPQTGNVPIAAAEARADLIRARPISHIGIPVRVQVPVPVKPGVTSTGGVSYSHASLPQVP
jgi:hypothetical protein